jgi:DNA repair protein SbcC/Rad50
MRLHRLQVQAFGPFAELQRVDFDALAESGLFLLHGPTGAGKTSVLDAVCFALYGRVPGVRNIARLRSDHAGPDQAPSVVCEFSVGARRFEVTRSPAWERPKRRGHGTTTEQSRVLLRESTGDGWRVLSQRVDEAGHLLDAVLGLSLDQFTKLVLLAQGEFAAFLRADAESRRAMLERLFETRRFAQVQSWLHEHQVQLKRRADTFEQATRDLLARAQQAGAVLPTLEPAPPQAAPGLPIQDVLPLEQTEPTPDQVVTELHTRAVQAWEAAGARREVTRKRATQARRAHDRVDQLAARQREHAELAQRLAAHTDAADGHARTRLLLRAADRAIPLAALAPDLKSAADQAERAGAEIERALTRLDQLGVDRLGVDQATDEHLDTAVAQLNEQLGRLDDLRAVETRQTELGTELAELDRSAAAAGQAHRSTERDHAQLSAQLAAAREQQVAAAAAVESVQVLQQTERQSADLMAAVATRDRLRPEVAAATQARDRARARQLEARDRSFDLRERRLAGMAAELAGRLHVGHPCPVCGAAAHPAPAPAGPSAVTETDEQVAVDRLQQAETGLDHAETALQALAEQLAAAAALAGDLTPRAAAGRHRAAAQALASAQQAGVRAAELAAVLQQADVELVALTERLAATAAEAESAQRRLAGLRARHDELAARLAGTLGPADPGDRGTVGSRIAGLQRELTALRGYQAARQSAATAGDRLARARQTAAEAAAGAGFDTLDEALRSLLDADEHERLHSVVQAYEAELAGLRARLATPDLVEAAARPAAEPTEAATTFELAAADEDAASRDLALCEQAVEALGSLLGQITAHQAEAAPVREQYRLAADLARCADGTGGDNTLRMSLSAYVLAARLEQVAEAASLRLLQMSGGRYALTHTDAVQRGRGRSGLGLMVLDGWTGLTRDTASLSGGETFYTSLALALGLADVVSAESGGTAIETLFVDEGFGTLDEQTLEDVMDVLDGLRAGGRAVGLVSHVADLRDRIPAQLEVIRGRGGSVLRQSGRPA